MPDSDVLAS